jgi:hypothetical protein
MEICMKLNYQQMSDEELINYIRTHKTDEEAIRELFVNRRSPDESATWYSVPLSPEGIELTQELIRQKIQS